MRNMYLEMNSAAAVANPVVREVQMAGDRYFAAFASTAENTQNLLGHL